MTYEEIIKETQFLLGFENDLGYVNYSLEAITRHSNRALDKLSEIIFEVDADWQWDDRNHPDLPIATTDLVAEQMQYTLDVEHLTVDRLELKNPEGNWIVLENIDETDIDVAVDMFQRESGTPYAYDVQGESLLLYPAPNYAQAESLKIYYSRPASYFTTTDLGKKPGFNTLFHEYIPLWNAYHYSSSNIEMQGVSQGFLQRLNDKEEAIRKHYRKRRRGGRIRPKTSLARW